MWYRLRTVVLFTLLVFLQLVLHGVRGQYLLQMSVYSYSNPDSQCIVCRDSPTAELGCCDNHGVTDPDECDAFSSRLCDIFLTFCPRVLNTTTRGSPCPNNPAATYPTSTDFNVREYTFDPVLLIFLTVVSGWNGIQVYVVMNDDDFGSPREVELVDSFAIDLTFPVGTATDRTTYNGQFGLAQIDLSFNLVCLENYFGPDCLKFCDKSISNCSCGPGFTGEFCQTNIDDCARLSVNCSGRGRCVDGINNYTCVCDSGFTGISCMYVPTFDRVPVVVGGVAGLVALLTGLFLIVVIVAAVCKRRRSKAEEFDDLQLNPMYGVVHIQGHQTSAENIGVLESESYIETKPNIVYGLTTDRDGQSKAVEFLDNRESMQGCEYEYIDVDGIYNRYE